MVGIYGPWCFIDPKEEYFGKYSCYGRKSWKSIPSVLCSKFLTRAKRKKKVFRILWAREKVELTVSACRMGQYLPKMGKVRESNDSNDCRKARVIFTDLSPFW